MLQSAWRIRCARTKVRALREERRSLLEQNSARTLQSAWRSACAKKRVKKLRLARDNNAATKIATMFRSMRERKRYSGMKKAAIVLQKRWRICGARKMTKAMYDAISRPIHVRVRQGMGLRAADSNGKSDPYVVITVFDRTGLLVTQLTGSTIKSTLNPEWMESFMLPGVVRKT
jgi:hypothetical protein